jgi:hypothetical protein
MKRAIALALCLMLTVACSESDYHKAANASAKIASGLAAIEQINENSYHAGLLSKEESVAIAGYTIEATRANDVFVGRIKSLGSIDTSNRALVVGWFGDVAASIQLLNEQGVLHVKNPDTKAKLAIAVTAVQASVQIIQALLGMTAQPSPRAGILQSAQRGTYGPDVDFATRPRQRICRHEAGRRDQGATADVRPAALGLRDPVRRADARCGGGVYRQRPGIKVFAPLSLFASFPDSANLRRVRLADELAVKGGIRGIGLSGWPLRSFPAPPGAPTPCVKLHTGVSGGSGDLRS